MNKLTKTKFILCICLVVLLVAAMFTSVFAALFSSSVVVGGEVSLGTVNSIIPDSATSEFVLSSGSADLEFSQPGEVFDFSLSLTNNSSACYHFYYGISLISSSTSGLESAVLVYLDGSFIGTLAALCSNTETVMSDGFYRIDADFYILPAQAAQGDTPASAHTTTHTLSFELHNATDESYYGGKTCQIKVCSYAKTINYQEVTFVTSETDFSYAIADVNNNLDTTASMTILLGQDITLSEDYTISRPCTIDLLGNELIMGSNNITMEQSGRVLLTSSVAPDYESLTSGTGQFILNSANTVFDIDSFYSGDATPINVGRLYSAKVNTTNCIYDTQAVLELVSARFYENIGNGVISGQSVDIFDTLYFYVNAGTTVSTVSSDYTYSNGTITAPSGVSVSYPTTITIGGTSIDFKIIGTGNDAIFQSLLANELAHIPDSTGETLIDVTSDLFLPTAIPDKNITIEWQTSNETFMTTTGKMGIALGRTTLTALVNINNQTFTHVFTFRVYGQNNESKFAYYMALLNPLNLKEIYDEDGSVIQLPVVDPSSQYDYRSSYSLQRIDSTTYFMWGGCDDLDLTSVSYSISNIYNYVTVDGTTTYLAEATFNTFAQIDVQATFEDDDTVYYGMLNVVIELGDDAGLQELVFQHVESATAEVNILNNIISTRTENGMINENGNFSLPDTYMNYEISYSIPSSNTIFTSTTHDTTNGVWNFVVDASKFYSSETDVAITCTIQAENTPLTQQNRTIYISTPAAIHNDTSGFYNTTVFYSVKYQVWQQLPAVEKANTSGFTVSGSQLTYTEQDYILLRDIEYCTDLVFANNSNDILMSMLTWAVSKTTATASSVVGSTITSSINSGIDSSFSSYSNNGLEFINETEATAISDYVEYCYTGSNFNSEFSTVWDNATVTETSKILVAGFIDAFMDAARALGNITTYFYEAEANLKFKLTEMVDWAIYAKITSGGPNDNVSGAPQNAGYLDSAYRLVLQDTSTLVSDSEEEVILNFISKILRSTTYYSTFEGIWYEYAMYPTYYTDTGRLEIEEFVRSQSTSTNLEIVNVSSFMNGRTYYTLPTDYAFTYVTSLDSAMNGLSYFTNLTRLSVYGVDNDLTPIFSSSNNVGIFFNRLTSNITTLETLELQYCSQSSSSTLDISTISVLDDVTYLDLSGNDGISSMGAIIDMNISELHYLDITGIDAELSDIYSNLAYIYFVYGSANSPTTAVIYYYKDTAPVGRTLFSPTNSDADYIDLLTCLYYLKDINEISSEYLQLAQKIYDLDGTDYDISWTINSGNTISEVELPSLGETTNSSTTLDNLLSNANDYATTNDTIYYTGENTTVGGISYSRGSVYELGLNNGVIQYNLSNSLTTAGVIDSDTAFDSILSSVNNYSLVLYEGITSGGFTQDNYYILTLSGGTISYVQSSIVQDATIVTTATAMDDIADFVSSHLNVYYTGTTTTSGGVTYTQNSAYQLTYNDSTGVFSYQAYSGTITGLTTDSSTVMASLLTSSNVGISVLYTGATTGSYTQNGIYKVFVSTANAVSYVQQSSTITSEANMTSTLSTANQYLGFYYYRNNNTNGTVTLFGTNYTIRANRLMLYRMANGLLVPSTYSGTTNANGNSAALVTSLQNNSSTYYYRSGGTNTSTTIGTYTFTPVQYYCYRYSNSILYIYGPRITYTNTATLTSDVTSVTTTANTYNGAVYQYTGTTTDNYTNGSYYQIVFDTTNNIFKWVEYAPYSVSADIVSDLADINQIAYYTGTTTTNYIQNSLYRNALVNGEYEMAFVDTLVIVSDYEILTNAETTANTYYGDLYLYTGNTTTDYTQYCKYQFGFSNNNLTYTDVCAPYVHVSDIGVVIDQLDEYHNSYHYYTGTTTTNYTQYGVYLLSYNGTSFSYSHVSTSRSSATTSMDDILANASSVDCGNYYYYTGDTHYSPISDFTYTDNYIYRLMNNNGNYYFTNTHDLATTGTQVDDIDDFMAYATYDNRNKIYQLCDTTANANLMSYLNYGIFEVQLNESTGAYYLAKIGSLSMEYDSTDTYLRLVNEKFYNPETNDYAYGGTGGTGTVILTVTISKEVLNSETGLYETVTAERVFRIAVTG